MNLVFWIVGVLIWCAVAMLIIARDCSKVDVEWIPAKLNRDLPICVVVSGLVGFVVLPVVWRTRVPMTLWVHHAAFAGLFIFLLAGQTLQIEGWLKLSNKATPASLLSTYKRLWWLTELMPAPVAVGILVSGIGLICQDGSSDPAKENLVNYSLRSGWLLLLVAAFGFFFWDGIFGYLPAVRSMKSYWETGISAQTDPIELRDGFKNWFRDSQLLAHFVSFPVVFLLGAYREPQTNVLANGVIWCEDKLGFLPSGLPQAVVAVAVWFLMGIVVRLVRQRGLSRTAADKTRG